MNYKEAISFIENTGKFGVNLGLQRVERLCELLGNPEKELKIIHVAGTNGKGSTTTFISQILMAAGYSAGIYTSPYIERFTERIKINDEEISEDEVAALIDEIKPEIDILISEGLEHPTEFEIITAAALKYFRDKQVDFVVLEVGLGGRFDATNIVTPLVSVITTISYDHMNILGGTLSKIAFEKAGIIKQGVPLVLYPQEKEAEEVILGVAREKEARVYSVGDKQYEILSDTIDGIEFNVNGHINYEGLKIKMLGEHQVKNALTALTAIEALRGIRDSSSKTRNKKFMNFDELSPGRWEDTVRVGLENASWPGRFEIVRRNPFVVLDGGHNLQGIGALVKALEKYFPGKKIKVVTGMLRDKEYEAMMRELSRAADSFITVEPNSPRALTSNELLEVVESLGKHGRAAASIEEGVKIGLEITEGDDVLVFCGSLYMIGEARSLLKR